MTNKHAVVRLTNEQRYKQIFESAYQLAKGGSLMTMSLANIADGCPIKCSKSTVKFYFKSLKGVRTAVIKLAIADHTLDILAVALVNKEPAAFCASEEQQRRALESLSNK